MALTIVKADRVIEVNGTLSSGEAVVLYAFRDGFKGAAYLNCACKGSAILWVEMSHDGGDTWTRVLRNAITASGGSTGYTIVAAVTPYIIPPDLRLVIEDTSSASNDVKIKVLLVSAEDTGAL